MNRFIVCYAGPNGALMIARYTASEREAWDYIKAQSPPTQDFYFILALVKG